MVRFALRTGALSAGFVSVLGGACEDRGSGAEAKRGRIDAATPAAELEPFSFFVTSYAAMQRLSGTPNGFGGDLRYGEADGLSGADKICREIAESSQAGAGKKPWRAFLSATQGPDDGPVHAIDRIGTGPWYDRSGRLLAMTREDLLHDRPSGADPSIGDDLPNEDGVPNHAPDGESIDNHDILTGTDDKGQLFQGDDNSTCLDWTSATGSDGRPRVGHSWPRDFSKFMRGDGGMPPGGPGDMGWRPPTGADGGIDRAKFDPSKLGHVNGVNWMSSLNEAGCAAGASLAEMGPPDPKNPTVGSGGGYGGIYCFSLKP
jgi:hypothetical protein